MTSNKNNHILTNSEKDVLKFIALGHTAGEIAVIRNCTLNTINNHRKIIKQKLKIKKKYELVQFARENLLNEAGAGKK